MDSTSLLRVLHSIPPASSCTLPVQNQEHGSKLGKKALDLSYKDEICVGM